MKKILISAGVVMVLAAVVIVVQQSTASHNQGTTIKLSSLLVDQLVPEQSAQATGIIKGTVSDVLPSQLINAGTKTPMVYTDYVISVEQSIKGIQPQQITLRLPGGTVGEDKEKVTVIAEDMPQFMKGQNVILFLADGKSNMFDLPAGHYTLYAGFHGAYSVKDGQASNEKETIAYNELLSQIQLGLSQ